MNTQRFNQVAVQILQALGEAADLGVVLPSRPSEELLLAFINKAKELHTAEVDAERAMSIASTEIAAMKAKLEEIPRWFETAVWGTVPTELKVEAEAAKQWVMVVSPSADALSWFTIAETLMHFKVTTFIDGARLAAAIGTKR